MLFWKSLYLTLFVLGFGLFVISFISPNALFGWGMALMMVAVIIQQIIKHLYTDVRMPKSPELAQLKQLKNQQDNSRINLLMDFFRFCFGKT